MNLVPKPSKDQTVVPASIHQIEKNGHYRVSIFGSARTKPGNPIYQMTYDFAKGLAERKIGVVTGGGPGVMEAANVGHKAGDVDDESESIGLTIRLPWEGEHNGALDIHQHYNKFSGRLDEFMRLSNAAVVMPGGIGTCLELFYTWQLVQVGHICNIPIIVVGDTWRQLVNWVREGLLETEKTISPQDMDMVFTVKNADEAMNIIEDDYQAFLKAGDDYCFNWKKYK